MMVGRVLAGFQAGIITLFVIMAVLLIQTPQDATFSGIPVWIVYAMLIAGLTLLTTRMISGRGPLTIAAVIIMIGLICVGMYLTTRDFFPKHVFDIMAISLAVGVLLGLSWSIALAHSETTLPARKKGGL